MLKSCFRDVGEVPEALGSFDRENSDAEKFIQIKQKVFSFFVFFLVSCEFSFNIL